MKYISCIYLLLLFSFSVKAFDKVSEIADPLMVVAVHENDCDTINLAERLKMPDNKLVMFCASWCAPSYKELNRLYNEGVIDSLLNNNFSLIIISSTYPCIHLKSNQIDGDWACHFLSDFEIYYDLSANNKPVLDLLTKDTYFPYLFLIVDNIKEVESHGLKDSYMKLLQFALGDNSRRCPRCKGTGHVKPNPKSSNPDECVGICYPCRGQGIIRNVSTL